MNKVNIEVASLIIVFVLLITQIISSSDTKTIDKLEKYDKVDNIETHIKSLNLDSFNNISGEDNSNIDNINIKADNFSNNSSIVQYTEGDRHYLIYNGVDISNSGITTCRKEKVREYYLNNNSKKEQFTNICTSVFFRNIYFLGYDDKNNIPVFYVEYNGRYGIIKGDEWIRNRVISEKTNNKLNDKDFPVHHKYIYNNKLKKGLLLIGFEKKLIPFDKLDSDFKRDLKKGIEEGGFVRMEMENIVFYKEGKFINKQILYFGDKIIDTINMKDKDEGCTTYYNKIRCFRVPQLDFIKEVNLININNNPIIIIKKNTYSCSKDYGCIYVYDTTKETIEFFIPDKNKNLKKHSFYYCEKCLDYEINKNSIRIIDKSEDIEKVYLYSF